MNNTEKIKKPHYLLIKKKRNHEQVVSLNYKTGEMKL